MLSNSFLAVFDHLPLPELVYDPYSSSAVLPRIQLLTQAPLSHEMSPTLIFIFPNIDGGASRHNATAGKVVSSLPPLAPTSHLVGKGKGKT